MAIIGISGYAGSGKDTAGRIIQYLSIPHSKKSLDYVLAAPDRDRWLNMSSEWQIKRWADKLKQIASLLTGIPVEKFEDQKFKKTFLGPQWDYWTVEVFDNGKFTETTGRYTTEAEAESKAFELRFEHLFRMEYKIARKRMTVREFIQNLGTDAVRDGLHPNAWVNALMSDYKCVPADRAPGGWDCDNWIITDTRFENEAQAIKNKGGIIIRIDRPGVTATNGHISETALDNWDFDYRVNNNDTTDALALQLARILEKEGLLKTTEHA